MLTIVVRSRFDGSDHGLLVTRERMTSMAAVQLEYIRVQSEGNKTEAVKAAARANDKAAHAELNTLRARACNTECFDCVYTVARTLDHSTSLS